MVPVQPGRMTVRVVKAASDRLMVWVAISTERITLSGRVVEFPSQHVDLHGEGQIGRAHAAELLLRDRLRPAGGVAVIDPLGHQGGALLLGALIAAGAHGVAHHHIVIRTGDASGQAGAEATGLAGGRR